ncbi:hypothetical protein [Candidatus Pelagibacter sp. HIMB1483]|uniref:hypothetical protein n=1 Tax=Candidatus Pelagibacter sp. HIMB1483 TaxID=3415414 RepID=UPI003F87ADEB
MRVISKFFLTLLFLLLISISYLSIFGFETERFNSQIINKIKENDKNIEVELKKIKLVLNPFKFKLNVKTVGANFKTQNKLIEIESIKSLISLGSFFKNRFSIENLEISTKSLEIKNFISFSRSFRNMPELFILEKAVKKGYLIANIKLEFDEKGKIKDNYEINGFVRDARVNILNKYSLQKVNFIFNYKKDDLQIDEMFLSLNNLDFKSEKIIVKKTKNDFLIRGDINHKKFDMNEENIDQFIKPFLPGFSIEKTVFSSENTFSLQIKEGFKIDNLEINSNMIIEQLSVKNDFDLKNFFPNINNIISLKNNKVDISYKKNALIVNGKGDIIYQNKEDELNYNFTQKNEKLNFETSLKINDNPLTIKFLNYKKNENEKILIDIKGSKDKKNKIFINSLNLIENKNKISLKNLSINEKFEITKLDELNLEYTDEEKQKNLIKFSKKKDGYHLIGSVLNANNLIDKILSENDKDSYININSKINIDIDKILLDSEHYLQNFSGYLIIKNKEIFKADLNGNFSDNKKLNFTINFLDNEKITTLYIDKAKPIVRRYNFIKGFEEGSLDFYSSKKNGESASQLKIYDFKLKKLPLLTKILTLASLQGIADILSGEGIRFNEFEMNFRNKGNLMTIEEVYAIGPAISVLMDGYVEKNKLISLRGTLVPATTINKFIGSLPVLGKILVGSKTGEGVFGVSFKIKGPPKNLETSVNPIKTLTPRFITRTLEKIKKN